MKLVKIVGFSWASLLVSVLLAACGSSSGSASSPVGTAAIGTGGASATGTGDAGSGVPTVAPEFQHTFDPIPVAQGQEIIGMCQSWTLDNDAPFYVNKIVSTNQGKFHHSNWIWVPDTMYTGPDGTWTCSDRGFDQVAAGAYGGVFFAQSTQATSDTQGFPPGTAFQVPPHARVVGDVHLINTSSEDATTSLHLDVYTIPEDTVHTNLQPMAFTNLALDIAPGMVTHARMQCATPQPNFNVYYILPHFHALGTSLDIGVVGGPMDGTTIFQSSGTIGESVGKMFDPPIAVTGATSLAVTCNYQNPTGVTVKYGEGNQEMCVALLYTDGAKAGGESLGNVTTTNTGNEHDTEGSCLSL